MTSDPKRELVEVRQEDRDAAADWFAEYAGKTLESDCMREGLSDHWPLVQAFARHRHTTLEQAAKACEEQAREFLSEQYAYPQPCGSMQERFACDACASAIRSLAATRRVHEEQGNG